MVFGLNGIYCFVNGQFWGLTVPGALVLWFGYLIGHRDLNMDGQRYWGLGGDLESAWVF